MRYFNDKKPNKNFFKLKNNLLDFQDLGQD